MDYKKNAKYFKKSSFKAAIVFIIIGIILLIFLYALADAGTFSITLWLIGIIPVAIGILIIALQIKGRVGDKEYDDSVSAMIRDMKPKALEKLGIDEDEVSEIEPIVISGYEINNCKAFKMGKDKSFRTDIYKVIMMFFSTNEIHCYTYLFNTLIPQSNEKTDVYFYKDIVSVSTSSETVNVPLTNESITYESFKINTSGGTVLTATIKDKENTTRSINAMRQLLREKKHS